MHRQVKNKSVQISTRVGHGAAAGSQVRAPRHVRAQTEILTE